MLLRRDLAGNKDAEMSDALMHRVHDGLTVPITSSSSVEVGASPSLLRRSDVVAPGTEHDDRRLDVAQVDAMPSDVRMLAPRELVADEQLVGDPLHLLGVEQDRAPHHVSNSRNRGGFRVDLRIEVIGLLPIGVRRDACSRSWRPDGRRRRRRCRDRLRARSARCRRAAPPR